MGQQRIIDLFQIRTRFVRSVNLERDFADVSALDDYVVTPQIGSNFQRLADGLMPTSGQRAWRITGDYGTGKSSFALALAHLLSSPKSALPDQLKRVLVDKKSRSHPRLLPVLITGTRRPLADAVLEAVINAIAGKVKAKSSGILGKLRTNLALLRKHPEHENIVPALLVEASASLQRSGCAQGVLLILDELGKFLEFAALHPERQDVAFLQNVAEMAARSGETPLFVVGILHQGFQAYSDQLSEGAQREWEKVAGRFEELLFNQPLEQTAALVVDALNLRLDRLPLNCRKFAQRDMRDAIELGWFGPAVNRSSLIDLAPRLFPLHPTVLPVLVKLFGRFGQNERSLFSFLLSTEPLALRDYAQRVTSEEAFFRLHNLYDYARSAFGEKLRTQSYRSHWNQIESVVESFHQSDSIQLRVLKTVALLNMIDSSVYVASEDNIVLAISGANAAERRNVSKAISELRNKRLLHFRGHAAGYCLWPHTSVNLQHAYDEAQQSLGSPQRVSPLLVQHLETRPLVARKHYIVTGNLRHFEVRYVSLDELASALRMDHCVSDGKILIPLVETAEERLQAINIAQSEEAKAATEILIAIPPPVAILGKLVQEARRWEWVAQNVPELNHDSYAAEEVSRQLEASHEFLQRRLRSFIGLRQFGERTELKWFYRGKSENIIDGKELLSRLSTICDSRYCLAPQVHNELVNRRALSSAAAAARMRLIELILKNKDRPFLGMEAEKKPPEMSMYLSVLKRGGLHKEKQGSFQISLPPIDDDPCRFRPSLKRIEDFLLEQADARVQVSELFAELRRPPHGVRDGLHLLLLSVFAVLHEHELAFYENGAFQKAITGEDFMRIAKAPETFEIQLCRVTGIRGDVFDRLLEMLDAGGSQNERDVLQVVRPLCQFAAQLPAFTHRTKRLSHRTIAIRTCLTAAKEPIHLLFRDLPEACGFDAFPLTGKTLENAAVEPFVHALRESLDELRACYPNLLSFIRSKILEAFRLPEPFARARETIANAADGVIVAVTEPQLKAFCMRLRDRNLGESEWVESLGSLVCEKPPAKWFDSDTEAFPEQIHRLATKFKRVESAAFSRRRGNSDALAIRVALTRADGHEVEEVLHLSQEEQTRASTMERELERLTSGEARIGLAAISKILWRLLERQETLIGRPTLKDKNN